jgi:hypothetical protein
MELPNVDIEIIRNGLGLVAETNDNTCGIILAGEAVTGKLELNKAYALYSTDDAKALGLNPEGVNKEAYRHVSEFYSVAGSGKKLWILVVDKDMRMSEMLDKDAAICPAKVILDAAQGEIVALGITALADGGTVLDGLDSEVYSAMTKAQILADEYQKLIMPYVTILEGRKFTGDADTLRDLKTESKYRVAITLASTLQDGSASVGLVLGRVNSIPVQRKVSRVKDGALPIDYGYLSDGSEVTVSRSDLNTIHTKRFIIFRKFPNKSEFFFNGDFTATSATDDLNMIARIRTIDKATKIAYNTYVEELDDDVEVNDDGTLNNSVAGYLKEKIENQVGSAMQGEISNFVASIDTTIDILAGNPQKIYLDITPKGYLNPIKVILGFKNE